jgi:hypothetical protein
MMSLTACGRRAARRATQVGRKAARRMTGNAGAGAADSHVNERSTDFEPADHAVVSPLMESTHFARSDASALADLQLHWGSGYEIGLDGDIGSATFRGTADQLRAHTATELRVLIRADYAYRQQAGPGRHLPPEVDADQRGEDRQAGWPNSAGDGVIRGERMSL